MSEYFINIFFFVLMTFILVLRSEENLVLFIVYLSLGFSFEFFDVRYLQTIF